MEVHILTVGKMEVGILTVGKMEVGITTLGTVRNRGADLAHFLKTGFSGFFVGKKFAPSKKSILRSLRNGTHLPGLPDFSWCDLPNLDQKCTKLSKKFTKWP
jgi:hypothetical protein